MIHVPPLPDDNLKEELEKFYQWQRFFDHATKVNGQEEQEEQWSRRLEQTHPITPGLLKSCFMDLNFDQIRIDSGKV